jgi:sarcosine oxidase
LPILRNEGGRTASANLAIVLARDFDYIVLGLGGIGSATAYWLARETRGRVLGLEQFELGHSRGESQDHSRIIRRSYHAPEYVKLADRAYRTWAEVEADARERLVLRTGGLDLYPAGSAISAGPYLASMSACGVPFEELDAPELMRRWPAFRMRNDVRGVFQPDGGIAMAARANEAHQRLARRRGATLLERTAVTGIREKNGEIDVSANGANYRAKRLVICAGPWTNHALAHFGIRLPLEVTKEQVTYFAARDRAAFSPERFPVWIWMDDPCFYGFPAFGEDGPKIAQDAGGKPVDPDKRSFEPDPEAQARVYAFLERHLPAALGPPIYTKTCLYTLTPDRDFIVDFVPETSNVAFFVGAGHAFKFASVLGKILCELVVNGKTESDISRFRAQRPILSEQDPRKTYMI